MNDNRQKVPRVALLMDTPNWAGTEAHIRDLALGLSAENVSVRVACPNFSLLAQKVRASGGRVFPSRAADITSHRPSRVCGAP